MNFTFDELKLARDRGYSDDEIWNTLASEDEEISLAKQRGYSIEEVTSILSGQPIPESFAKPIQDEGTSFAKEIGQLGPAFIESIGRPLESMGETADVLGMSGIASALKGAITEPENYESASSRFAEPKPGDSSFLGFAWQYAPRAAVEQAGQLVGSMATRAAGGLAGAPLGPAGIATGAFLGPAIFEAAQIIGPVAKERAMNNGREVPNGQDLAVGTLTALGSGALNAIGAKYLPGGEKATGKFFKRVATGFLGEAPTEAAQSIVEQTGGTAFTEKGTQINLKQAAAEGIIGGTSGSAINAVLYPFTPYKPQEKKIVTQEEAAELDIEGKSNAEAINLTTPVGDVETKQNLSKIKELESYKASNDVLLSALEPNEPEAQQINLENAAIDKEISKLKGGVINAMGVTPVTSVEEEQVRLAREIGAPIEEAPAEVAPAKVSEPITRRAELPRMPGIEEQTPEITYGGQLGLFDPFAGVGRRPVAPAIEEAAPVAEGGATMASQIVPQEVLEVFSENQPLMERIRRDALEKKGGSLQTYTTASVRTKGVPKSQIQSITNKVLKQLGESPTIVEVEDAITNEVENTASFKEKKKSDEIKLQSALQRTGETYELDVAIQDYKNKQVELERTQKSILATPALRRMERVGAKNNLEESKQKLIAIAEKAAPVEPTTPTPVTEQAAPAEAPAPEGAPIQRDVTKPEQMSFEEYKSAFNKAQKNLIDAESKLDKINKEEFPKSVKAQLNQSERRRKIENEIKVATQNLESYGGESVQQGVLYKALSENKPVNADVFDKLKYSSLPEGYVKQGELYVYQPTPAVSETITEPTQPTPLDRSQIGTATEESVETQRLRENIKSAKGVIQSQRIKISIENGSFVRSVIDAAEMGNSFPNKGKAQLDFENLPQTASIDRIKLPKLKKKSPEEAAQPLISDDDTRWVLGGILFDPDKNVVISTNGRAIVVLPSEVSGKRRIVAARNIKSQNIKKGDLIEGNYPNWAQVIPSYGKDVPKTSLDIEEARKASTVLSLINKSFGLPHYKIMIGDAKLDPEYVLKSINALVESGATAITAQVKNKMEPILFTGDNGSIAIVMPMRASVENGYRLGAAPVKPTQPEAKPAKKDVRKMAAVSEDISPVPQDNQKQTLEEEATTFFGGTMPEKLVILNDSTDPDYQFKAGYDTNTGQIILNQAYIGKDENVADILTHELGHFAWGDKGVQTAFQDFWNGLSESDKQEVNDVVNSYYSEEDQQIQMEEAQVRAFAKLANRNKSTWTKFVDAVKRVLNRLLGTKFNLSDRGAGAVLAAAMKQFQSGERIVREINSGVLKTAETAQDARFAELEARAKAGDKEAEAEAQRMVDEAAKAAGYLPHADFRDSHRAPSGPFSADEEVKNGDADASLVQVARGTHNQPDDYFDPRVGPRYYSYQDKAGMEAFRAIRAAMDKIQRGKKAFVTVYRAVPIDIKNARLENRDWVTPSKTYAIDHGESRFGEGEYRIIKESVRAENLFWDGNDIREWGKDDSQNYFYKNTENNIKLADPFTYDDAGNLIPLSQRFRATSPDIRRMAAERITGKSQVAGIQGIGAEKDTPKGINAKTEEIIRKKVFSAAEVSDNNTKKAWTWIERMDSVNPESFQNAQAVNEFTRETMQDVDTQEVVKQTIGAIKLKNELYTYAIKLAAQGKPQMLQHLLNTRLALTGAGIVQGDQGLLLQAEQSLKNAITHASEAEQEGFFTIAAQQFFDTSKPTKEQVQQIKDIFNRVKQTKIDQEKELMDEIEEVGKAAGVELPKIIEKELTNSPALDPMVLAIQNLQRTQGGTILTQYIPFSQKAKDIREGVQKIIKGGITGFRDSLVKTAANGLEVGFWKTMANTENKPGPLGELDSYMNRELAKIVKDTLVGLGLKGEPPNTKMGIIEQVASILNEASFSQDKAQAADKNIRASIEAKRQAELEGANAQQEAAVNAKYDQILLAWDESMSRQLEMPISNTLLRRLLLAELREGNSSIAELADLMESDPVIGASRQDRLVNAVVSKVAGVTFEGQPSRDYTTLTNYLSEVLESMIQTKIEKNKAGKNANSVKRKASGSPESQAQSQIDKLAKVQADPTIFGEKQIDPVRTAVADALSLKLNIGFSAQETANIKRTWKGSYVADPNQKGLPTSFMLTMQRLGVKEETADVLANIVWNQIEVNAMNRQMELVNKSVEFGPIGGMVQSILDTPLYEQQDPEWRKNVIKDYIKNAGVDPRRIDSIASLFDLSLRKRFAQAQEKAAEKAAKGIKGGLTPNSKRALEKFLKAIRAQVLDPGKDVAKAFGEQMGWKGFTPEQLVKLNELDAIFSDETRTDAERAATLEKINNLIDEVSAPVSVKDVLSSFYVGNALMRFTTFAVQAFDPAAFATFNLAIDTLRNVTSPSQLWAAWSNYGQALTNLFRETAFSFGNDTLRSGRMIDYLDNQDRASKKLWKQAGAKWNAGNYQGAFKDGLFGYTYLTFRTLKALDDGAYSLLVTSTLPRYVDTALKMAKVPKDKRLGVMRDIQQGRQLDIKQMIADGVDKNDAVVYANERMMAAVTRELGKLNIPAQDVINSAINDALSRIGKTRFTEDIIDSDKKEIKDRGFLSSPLLKFYEGAAQAAQKSGSESQKIFYRILFGFPLIPARIFNVAAGYTPLTLYRHLPGLANRYELTYGTAIQRRQRLVEQLSGAAVLLPLLVLRSLSLDDEDEKEKGFGIYITGQGPRKSMDKETWAQWNKKFQPYSISYYQGGKRLASIDAKSSGPLSVLIYTLGAIDDWQIRRKQEGLKTGKRDWDDVEEKASVFQAMLGLAGSFILTTARRSPTTGVMQGLVDFQRFPDDPLAALAADASFSAMPAVPVLGAGVVKNLSDFFSEPMDRTTKEGAIYANMPIVGPLLGKPALNGYGQTLGELHFSEKLKKSFGVPFTLLKGQSPDDMKLMTLTFKFGNGPEFLRRQDVENALQSSLSDEEWYLAAKTYGEENRAYAIKDFDNLMKDDPKTFAKIMSNYARGSKEIAIQAVEKYRKR